MTGFYNRDARVSCAVQSEFINTVQRTAPQGSPRTPTTCIAATTPELIVGILNSVFFKFFKF